MKGWTIALCCLALLSVGWVGVFVVGDSDAYSDSVAQARALGYASFLLLSAALCVSPFRRWVAESSKLRRTLGLLAASMALIHAEVALWSSPLSIAEQLEDRRLRFGFAAFAVLSVLALTSFPSVVVWLKLRSWKELHRLAYVAWICALIHGVFSPYAWLRGLSVIAMLVFAIGLLRLLPRAESRKRNRNTSSVENTPEST